MHVLNTGIEWNPLIKVLINVTSTNRTPFADCVSVLWPSEAGILVHSLISQLSHTGGASQLMHSLYALPICIYTGGRSLWGTATASCMSKRLYKFCFEYETLCMKPCIHLSSRAKSLLERFLVLLTNQDTSSCKIREVPLYTNTCTVSGKLWLWLVRLSPSIGCGWVLLFSWKRGIIPPPKRRGSGILSLVGWTWVIPASCTQWGRG